MLVLLFHIGKERWALAADEITAVLPIVSLQPFAHGDAADKPTATEKNRGNTQRGLLNYHGELLPAIDVSAVVGNRCAPQTLSTRIAVVERSGQKRLALVLDNASETVRLSTTKVESVQTTSPYIRALLQDSTQSTRLAVPLLNTDSLLAEIGKNPDIVTEYELAQ